MKIAVSSRGNNINAPYDYRLNNTPHVIILDSTKLQYKDMPLLDKGLIHSDKTIARILIDEQVDVLVTGECSDTVTHMLDNAHIRLYEGKKGSVKENVLAFYKKELNPKISEHYSIDESFVNWNLCLAPKRRATKAPANSKTAFFISIGFKGEFLIDVIFYLGINYPGEQKLRPWKS